MDTSPMDDRRSLAEGIVLGRRASSAGKNCGAARETMCRCAVRSRPDRGGQRGPFSGFALLMAWCCFMAQVLETGLGLRASSAREDTW